MIRKGKIIVFEGLDYSFKETNSKRLEKYIKNNISDKVMRIEFPQYNSISSIFVKNYLSGKYGGLNDIDSNVVSLFYALDRYDTLKSLNIDKLLEEGYYIILDRYVGSNLCFQTAKLNTDEEKENFISNEYRLEITKMKLPKPDITIFMNMPIDFSFKLLNERDAKGDMSKDIHESNYNYMLKVEKESKNIIKLFNWKVVNCIENNKIRLEDNLFNNIIDILNNNNII